MSVFRVPATLAARGAPGRCGYFAFFGKKR
jgi:hypothetical protein